VNRDFKFGAQVDHGKSQSVDDKLSLKEAWSRHVTHFKFLPPPLKYYSNGLSWKLQILYTGWPRQVLALGLTSSSSSGRGLGHVTSLNFWQIVDNIS